MKQFTLAIFCMVTLTSLSCMAQQTHNGHEYVDLGLPSGTLWATCNIGATTPEGYGDYFAWGETEPKTSYDRDNYQWGIVDWEDEGNYGMTKYNVTDGKTILDSIDDAASVNWGGSWRMPTFEEIKEILDSCTFTWTTQNNVNGCIITGKNGNCIFLPAAGSQYKDTLSYNGTSGEYLSSSLFGGGPLAGWNLYFRSDFVGWGDGAIRYCGTTIRPVCKGVTSDVETEVVETFEAGGIYYNSLGGDSVEVTYKGESWDEFQDEYTGAIVIPATVAYNGKTYRVTSLATNAFAGTLITSLSIPESVTSIELPSAWGLCQTLTTLTVAESNPTLYSKDNCIIDKKTKELVAGCSGSVIPSDGSVTAIGNYAFNGCTGLTTITIPNTITRIGEAAFCMCLRLIAPIVIPNSVTEIGMSAFYYTGIPSVEIPNSITRIEEETFGGNENLTTITIPSSVTFIDVEAFSSNPNLQTVTYKATNPATITKAVFSSSANNATLRIPCGTKDAYTAVGWTGFKEVQETALFDFSVISSDETKGLVVVLQEPTCEHEAIIQAVPRAGYKFTAWQDGNTENPRIVTEDTQYIATFEAAESEVVPDIAIETGDTTAVFTWSAVEGADSYVLIIWADAEQTEKICTLTFNAAGDLTGIDFSRKKPASSHASGLSFTVTGLEAGTNYLYSLSSYDGEGTPLDSETGFFATASTTGLMNNAVSISDSVHKVIENGAIYILRDDEKYTVDGRRVM